MPKLVLGESHEVGGLQFASPYPTEGMMDIHTEIAVNFLLQRFGDEPASIYHYEYVQRMTDRVHEVVDAVASL